MNEIKIGDQVMRGTVTHFSIFDEVDNAPFADIAKRASFQLEAWGKEFTEYRKWEKFLYEWAAMQSPRIIFTNSIDEGKKA